MGDDIFDNDGNLIEMVSKREFDRLRSELAAAQEAIRAWGVADAAKDARIAELEAEQQKLFDHGMMVCDQRDALRVRAEKAEAELSALRKQAQRQGVEDGNNITSLKAELAEANASVKEWEKIAEEQLIVLRKVTAELAEANIRIKHMKGVLIDAEGLLGVEETGELITKPIARLQAELAAAKAALDREISGCRLEIERAERIEIALKAAKARIGELERISGAARAVLELRCNQWQEQAERAEAQVHTLRRPLSDLINLVEAIVDNDPDDLVAEGGITVLDAVRASADWMLKRARAALNPSPGQPESK